MDDLCLHIGLKTSVEKFILLHFCISWNGFYMFAPRIFIPPDFPEPKPVGTCFANLTDPKSVHLTSCL